MGKSIKKQGRKSEKEHKRPLFEGNYGNEEITNKRDEAITIVGNFQVKFGSNDTMNTAITRGTALVEHKPLPTIISNSATFNFGQNI